ncbi:protein GL2-INTERACTING REPRESSOR 1 [Ziziphus jujuba]|uniref:Protein GL2-INTERACTING REPRESSOR 1 n=2 Tax=Ziziphus jujuba TaxID=326968 RepID=A0ABM3IA28_ZIZJJ|nr:protein GL2-INTERACTING REPRESSOR 1 [Ziziphus jujuba]KAH7541793.1 hypothetical protein FEM48_Zijuj02G0005300 [Ziziphus jujuba var. spinosa]
MSGRGTSPKLEMELNLSPPRQNSQDDDVSPWNSSTSEMSSEISVVEGSCVSSETEESSVNVGHASSNSETTPEMVLVGCPRCLMYVMLSQVDPKCPKCNSKVLLDLLNID